jgi:hypothetical protein
VNAESKTDWFKVVIAVSVLIAASGVGYYFAIYLPGRPGRIAECIRDANNGYGKNWDSACAAQAKTCAAMKLPKEFCQLRTSTDNPEEKCRLPTELANNLNDHLHQEEQLCVQLYH